MLNHFDFKRLGVFERARCRAALQMCDVRSIRHVSIRWEAEYNPKRRYCSPCVVGSSKNKTKHSALIKQVKRPSAISCKLSKNRLIYIPPPPTLAPHRSVLTVSSQPRFITLSGKSVAISVRTAAIIFAESPLTSSSIWLPQHFKPTVAKDEQNPPE